MPSLAVVVEQMGTGLRALELRIPDDGAMSSAEADVSEQLEAMLEALPRIAEVWRASWR